MLSPYDVVRDAADLARYLADQAWRAGESDHAAYFERKAAEADDRADRLLLIQSAFRPRSAVYRQHHTSKLRPPVARTEPEALR